jgi:hypothetical protein
MKLLIRGGSIAAGHGVKKCYADILEESLLKKGITDDGVIPKSV